MRRSARALPSTPQLSRRALRYQPSDAAREGEGAESSAQGKASPGEVELSVACIPSADGTLEELRAQTLFEVELLVTNASERARHLLLAPAAWGLEEGAGGLARTAWRPACLLGRRSGLWYACWAWFDPT